MSKSAYRVLAIFCVVITIFGAIPEVLRITTSDAKDIADERIFLFILGMSITCGILYAASYFWKKGS
ncbi:hypothetical protein C8N46_105327 [Kordia periserrulae]|uniref:Uncharacterized protein n=1 Tax=Kordia periserrulae TaxID=701523 RepID=A0A2T6BYJ8_9FLAO|nr:hypothetical protein [Kordia periserrulae]PTX61170.1 hypothetical protein C8N46_105327 [Kordia periserrulae]